MRFPVGSLATSPEEAEAKGLSSCEVAGRRSTSDGRERATVNLLAVDHDDPLIGLAARTDQNRERRFVVRVGLANRAADLAPVLARFELFHAIEHKPAVH